MLQQTRISAVMDYYTRFLAALPDIQSLALVEEDTLLKLWQGLGYYSRARNMKRAAEILMQNYDCHFPTDYDAIRSLPGIGDYTAGAIASIAFGISVPAVDGNVMRVITRLTADGRDIAKEQAKAYFRSKISDILPADCPGEFNQALMELGELICLPNGSPLCEDCPLKNYCKSYAMGCPESYPIKGEKQKRKIEKRVVWVILDDKRVALRKRPDKGLLASLWEFPNQISSDDLKFSEWKIVPLEAPSKLISGKHVFSHLEWHMEAYVVHTRTEALPDDWVWATKSDLEDVYALPSAFAFLISTVEQFL